MQFQHNRILNLLLDSNEIISPDTIRGTVGREMQLGNDAILMLIPNNAFWVIPVLNPSSNFTSAVVASNAKTGERITKSEALDELKAHKNSYSSFQWLPSENVDTKPAKLLNEEFKK